MPSKFIARAGNCLGLVLVIIVLGTVEEVLPRRLSATTAVILANPVLLGSSCNSLQQQQELIAPDNGLQEQFGTVVSISGDTLAVGAPWDNIGANSRQGSVYIFVRNQSSWDFQQKLTAVDGASDDRFGSAISLSGDTVMVGSPLKHNGNFFQQGAVYVFVRNGATWSQQQKLLSSDGSFGDKFGSSLMVEGDTFVTSSPGKASNAGAAYVFARSAGAWSEQQKLTPADSANSFGVAVAVQNDTALLGASGAAYAFTRSGSSWTQQQKLTAADGGNGFGLAVALSTNTVVIGAPEATIGASASQGAAYVFERSGTVWSQQQKLTAADGAANDRFGGAVAVNGETTIVGASNHRIGTNASQGASYVFARSGTIWNEQQQLTPLDGSKVASFGATVSFDGNRLSVGAPFYSLTFSGQQGAVYVFECSTCVPLALAPTSLPLVTVNTSYNQTITATGGTAPYVFSLAAGVLPQGVTLSPSGNLTGTPTVTGNFNFTVRVTDATGCTGVRPYVIKVVPPCGTITLTPSALPRGEVGVNYNANFFVEPTAISPYTFAITAGSLPPGLTFFPSSTSASLGGIPTVSGTFNFTLSITDDNGCTGSRAYTLMIVGLCASITVTSPSSLPVGTFDTTYSYTLMSTGGVGAITWSIPTGTLPNGLFLNENNGTISGTPTVVGTFNFKVRATDAGICFGELNCTLVIEVGGLVYFSLPSPVRLLDTRPGASPNACSQPNAAILGNTARTQTARNFCGIPANAVAITGHITTVDSGGGYLTLYPGDATQPIVANSNFTPNQVLNNVFTVRLGTVDGAFKIFVTSNTDVVIDVTGYYAPPNTGGLYFHPLPVPVRLLETRAGQPVGCFKPNAPIPSGVAQLQQGNNTCGIPASAQALVGNATTVSPVQQGYLTLYPNGATQPLIASSNYSGGDVINGPFTVGLGTGGMFKIFASTTTELVIDVIGYYSTESVDMNGAGLLFKPLERPVRLLETRATPNDLPGCNKTLMPSQSGFVYALSARIDCMGLRIPNTARGIVGNVTVVSPTNGGYLTIWPNQMSQPTVATSNFSIGAVLNRHFIVGLSAIAGSFNYAFNMGGSQFLSELVIDVSGYFAP